MAKLFFLLLCTLLLIPGNLLAGSSGEGGFSSDRRQCVSKILGDIQFGEIKMGSKDAFALMDIWTGRILRIVNPKVLSSYDFQPGSIFKVITAYVAIDSGGLGIHEIFDCKGNDAPQRDRGEQTKDSKSPLEKNFSLDVKCWLKTGHGPVDLSRALAYSCNLYFAHLGLMLPADELIKVAHLFGLGHSTGSDIPGEVSGSLPRRLDADDIGRFAVGQGKGVFVTGLQVLSLVGAIANDGLLLSPKVAKPEGGRSPQRGEIRNLNALQIIRTAMVQASQFGTGLKNRLYDLKLAGKTGTCQWRHVAWRTHGWYMGYWPIQSPAIAIVAFVHNGNGSSQAAALAKMAIEAVAVANNVCFLIGL